MSRVGKQPITIPSGVTVTVDDDMITVNGPKGSLEQSSYAGHQGQPSRERADSRERQ